MEVDAVFFDEDAFRRLAEAISSMANAFETHADDLGEVIVADPEDLPRPPKHITLRKSRERHANIAVRMRFHVAATGG